MTAASGRGGFDMFSPLLTAALPVVLNHTVWSGGCASTLPHRTGGTT
ncbi:hypothetical protein F750_0503 [Streptomyces sp. PAMC 26508]|nr:hypothetical protein F750_0503 [Streptomyces sp. PAMC 26508]